MCVSRRPCQKEAKDELRIFYPSNMNRASNARVIVHHADGETAKLSVTSKKPMDAKGHRLGEFRFEAGTTGSVEIRNDEANGYYCRDAVHRSQIAPQSPGAKAPGVMTPPSPHRGQHLLRGARFGSGRW